METKDIVLLAVTLVILGEVTYLLSRIPRTSIKSKDRAILIDTSVLMDGRITSLAATGFIGGTLVIPRSVVGELQFLADNADAEKRARARQGLDVITGLQNMPNVNVELLQDGSKANEGVDERLLTLAKRHNAVICTIDYNLNKVAAVEGITVLNINELAQSLRMAHLPGEHMMLELVQKGQDSHQAVGYLPDGTMVVVEQAISMLGQSVEIEVVRSLQTAAGKMMFARRVDRKAPQSGQDKKPAVQVAEKAKANGRKPAYDRKAPKQPRDKAEGTAVPTSSSQERPAASQRTQRRPQRRSVDREAALLELVDKQ
jgi:rRNA-processing protein FCF1